MEPTQNLAVETAIAPQDAVNKLLLQYASGELAKQQLKDKLKSVEEAQGARRDAIMSWVNTHKDEFDGKQSLALPAGTIGFKKEGERIVWDSEKTPKDYEAKLLKLMEQEHPAGLEQVVNKKWLLKAWGVMPDLRKKLQKLGASVRNESLFYIALKK